MTTRNALGALCRWTARVIAALLLGLFLIFAIGEGLPNLLTLSPAQQAETLAFAFVFGGILIGWRWELVGGLLSLVSAGFFLSSVGGPAWFVVALAIPGALLITSALLRRADIGRSKS